MHELQSAMCETLGALARYWIRGDKGQEWVKCVEDERARRIKTTRLRIQEVEDYFGFTHLQYRAIWYPIQWVCDPSFWVPGIGNTGNKPLFNALRVSTLTILVRFITILTTGKMNSRVLSNAVRFKVLDVTNCRNVEDWPMLVARAKRLATTSAWENYRLGYPPYGQCEELNEVVVKLDVLNAIGDAEDTGNRENDKEAVEEVVNAVGENEV